MALEKSTPLFNGEKNEDQILQKTLKVINKPYNGKNVPCINLQGDYLKVYGFKAGNKLLVKVIENVILIEKVLQVKFRKY